MKNKVYIISIFFLFVALHAFCNNQKESYIIEARSDRLGANATTWAAAILLSELTNTPLYHKCFCHLPRAGQIMNNKLFHQILVNYCRPFPIPRENTTNLPVDPYGQLHATCMKITHTNFPSSLKNIGLSDKWFNFYNNHAKKNRWILRWNPSTALVVHVRLEDVAPGASNEGHGLLNGAQLYIGDAKLNHLLKYLHNKFPDHEIHLVTSPFYKDIERCKRIASLHRYVKGVWGDQNEDYALWQMMCCDVLILSRSTFSFLAGLMHQGSKCYVYEDFDLFRMLYGNDKNGPWEVLDIDFTSANSLKTSSSSPNFRLSSVVLE